MNIIKWIFLNVSGGLGLGDSGRQVSQIDRDIVINSQR